MASKKKQAAKAGAGAVAAGKAVQSNPYVQTLIQDEEVRENLRTAVDSARRAYERMANGKAPAKALMDDKKVKKELKEAATSLRDAAETLRDAKSKPKRKRRGGLLLIVVGVAVAVALSEDLRKKILDALFGAEEEFEYSSTTTPPSAGTGAAA